MTRHLHCICCRVTRLDARWQHLYPPDMACACSPSFSQAESEYYVTRIYVLFTVGSSEPGTVLIHHMHSVNMCWVNWQLDGCFGNKKLKRVIFLLSLDGGQKASRTSFCAGIFLCHNRWHPQEAHASQYFRLSPSPSRQGLHFQEWVVHVDIWTVSIFLMWNKKQVPA